MHIEIRVPESYNVENILQKLKDGFDGKKDLLKSIRLEVVRSDYRTLEGSLLIRAIVSSTTEEELAGHHEIASKILERNGFEVKSERYRP